MVLAIYRMGRRPLLLVAVGLVALLLYLGHVTGHGQFAPEGTPEGAYARIAFAVAQRRPADAFAYLEEEAQWASFTIRDLRKRACDRVRASYPTETAAPLLAAWQDEASSRDGPDLFALLAARRGWVGRLERDLSGVGHVDIEGERATVVTARGTRYPFRRRKNGIWGLTIFTAELQTEAEKAARDLEVVQHAADDYDRSKAQP